MKKLISNHLHQTTYFNISNGDLLSRRQVLAIPGWPDRLRNANLDAHFQNGVPPITRPDRYEPVAGIVPLPPRTRWIVDGQRFEAYGVVCRTLPFNNTSLVDIEHYARKYVSLIEGKRIAVELSGGLDTSMIIDVLKSAGANLVLVGVFSDRYEFRTERAIQELYANQSELVVRLHEKETQLFARLEQTPIHPIPLVPALFHNMHSSISSAAFAHGAQVVVNGVGGDALCCDAFDGDAEYSLPFSHHSWGICDPWPNDNIYTQKGMVYISGFSVWPIPNCVWSMRRGQKEDPQKRYARQIFDGRLPKQLTKFAYKADHAGCFHDDLNNAIPEIYQVSKIAFEFTRRRELHPDKLISDIRNSVFLVDSEIKGLLLSISYATWIHAFKREGII